MINLHLNFLDYDNFMINLHLNFLDYVNFILKISYMMLFELQDLKCIKM